MNSVVSVSIHHELRNYCWHPGSSSRASNVAALLLRLCSLTEGVRVPSSAAAPERCAIELYATRKWHQINDIPQLLLTLSPVTYFVDCYHPKHLPRLAVMKAAIDEGRHDSHLFISASRGMRLILIRQQFSLYACLPVNLLFHRNFFFIHRVRPKYSAKI